MQHCIVPGAPNRSALVLDERGANLIFSSCFLCLLKQWVFCACRVYLGLSAQNNAVHGAYSYAQQPQRLRPRGFSCC